MRSSVAKWSRPRVNVAVRRRAEERGVHDVLDARCGRRVDEGVVLLQPVLGLGGGDHEQRFRPGQRRLRPLRSA